MAERFAAAFARTASVERSISTASAPPLPPREPAARRRTRPRRDRPPPRHGGALPACATTASTASRTTGTAPTRCAGAAARTSATARSGCCSSAAPSCSPTPARCCTSRPSGACAARLTAGPACATSPTDLDPAPASTCGSTSPRSTCPTPASTRSSARTCSSTSPTTAPRCASCAASPPPAASPSSWCRSRWTAAQTYEDPSITAPQERRRAFLQHDHVRLYAPDIADRLRRRRVHRRGRRHGRRARPGRRARYGLLASDLVFLCRRLTRRYDARACGLSRFSTLDLLLVLARAALLARLAEDLQLRDSL